MSLKLDGQRRNTRADAKSSQINSGPSVNSDHCGLFRVFLVDFRSHAVCGTVHAGKELLGVF
jgi:hypothetical protein